MNSNRSDFENVPLKRIKLNPINKIEMKEFSFFVLLMVLVVGISIQSH